MKGLFVNDLLTSAPLDTEVRLLGWVKSRRNHRHDTFLDVVDSTGMIQVVVNEDVLSAAGISITQLAPESAVDISGRLVVRKTKRGVVRELLCNSLVIAAPGITNSDFKPRSVADPFSASEVDALLRRRHLLMRNPRMIAMMKFRHAVMRYAREWFEANQFTELTAPILTPLPLYDDATAIPVTVDGQSIFLTQCVGFYLEAAAQGLERVYNMGPSFRNEESRSKRHLMEYWHIKGEVAFADLEDAIRIVESIISTIARRCAEESQALAADLGSTICVDGISPPYPRITYREAVERLQANGRDFEFGKSLTSDDEEFLSQSFSMPFWVVGIPRAVEPFPYVIDPSDPAVTRTADLIATRGYGELLGVAEKIADPEQLIIRMAEKDRADDQRYDWVREVHAAGCVPHIGFGMGLERLMRWLIQFDHVRDTIPFPRVFRRAVHP